MAADIYREIIMDYYRNPRNYGKITNPDFYAVEENIFCGDSIEVSGKLKSGKIADIKFQGRGCVISQAAASAFTEFVKNKSVSRVKKLKTPDTVKLLGITLTPTRMKCAELVLLALKKGLITKQK